MYGGGTPAKMPKISSVQADVMGGDYSSAYQMGDLDLSSGYMEDHSFMEEIRTMIPSGLVEFDPEENVLNYNAELQSPPTSPAGVHNSHVQPPPHSLQSAIYPHQHQHPPTSASSASLTELIPYKPPAGLMSIPSLMMESPTKSGGAPTDALSPETLQQYSTPQLGHGYKQPSKKEKESPKDVNRGYHLRTKRTVPAPIPPPRPPPRPRSPSPILKRTPSPILKRTRSRTAEKILSVSKPDPDPEPIPSPRRKLYPDSKIKTQPSKMPKFSKPLTPPPTPLSQFTIPDPPAPPTPTDTSSYSLALPVPASAQNNSLMNQITFPDVLPVITQGDLVDLDAPPKPDKRLLAVHASQKSNTPDVVQRDGKILALTLYNFMSHLFFTKEWNSSINYITGVNGSGKSAFSTAIAFALGANAFQSGRTQKISGLINEKRENASVEITLSNACHTLNAEKYGSRIIIARSIDKNGSKMKIAKGKYPPEKKPAWRDLNKQELDKIKISLGIMPDNHFQILKQVDVKHFFTNKKPRELYNILFFALGYCQCESEVSKGNEHHAASVSILSAKKTEINSVKTKYSADAKQVQKIEAMENLAPKIEALEKEYSWAIVFELEQDKNRQEAELGNLRDMVADWRTKRINADKTLKEFRNEFSVQLANLKQMKEDLNKKKELERNKRGEITFTNSQIKKLNNKMKHLDSAIATIKNNVEEVRRTMRTVGVNQEEREELNKTINDIVMKINIGTEKIRQLEAEELSRKRNIEECEKTERDTKFNLQRLNKLIEENKKEAINLKKSKGGLYNNWPIEMKRIVEKMGKTAFKKKPYGPMCRYYTVKDEKWRPVIENVHSGTLFSFTVDNMEDKDRLTKVFQEVYNKNDPKQRWPEVLINSYIYKKHDIATKKASGSPYPTIFDMIEIEEDPIVFNWLVDRLQVERRLLIENRTQAAKFMNSKKVPKYCIGSYTLDYYNITPQPNFELWDMKEPRGNQPQYLKLTTDDSLTASLRQLENERLRLEEEFREMSEKYDAEVKNTKASRELNERMKMMPSSKDKTTEVNQLKSQRRQYSQKLEICPDPTTLNEEIQTDLEEINKKEEEKKTLSIQIEEQYKILQDLNVEVKNLEDEIISLNSKMSKLGDNKKSFSHRETQLIQIFKDCEANFDKHKSDKDTLEKKVKLITISVNEKISEAEKSCERMENIRDTKTIKEELETLKMQRKSWKEKIALKSKLVAELEVTRKKLTEITKEYKFCKNLTNTVGAMLKAMERELRISKECHGTLVMGRFINLATTQNTTGTIAIDHEEKTLSFSIHPDSSSEMRATRNFLDSGKVNNKETKNYVGNLSGGERILATFCFMLATWTVMQSPFHIIDEIDVFLDDIKQERCLEALFKHMMDNAEAQFFVISPLEVTTNEVPPPERFCHIRLGDPRTSNNNNGEEDVGDEYEEPD